MRAKLVISSSGLGECSTLHSMGWFARCELRPGQVTLCKGVQQIRAVHRGTCRRRVWGCGAFLTCSGLWWRSVTRVECRGLATRERQRLPLADAAQQRQGRKGDQRIANGAAAGEAPTGLPASHVLVLISNPYNCVLRGTECISSQGTNVCACMLRIERAHNLRVPAAM